MELKRIYDILNSEDDENISVFQTVDNYRRMKEYLTTLKNKFIDTYWSQGLESEKKARELMHELDRTLFDNSGEDE